MKKWFAKIISFFRKNKLPEINKPLSTAIDDKLAKRKLAQDITKDIHTKVLNTYLVTYFKKEYKSVGEMQFAFGIANKKWQQYVREINSTNKLINLNKRAFQIKVKEIIEKSKQNGKNN